MFVLVNNCLLAWFLLAWFLFAIWNKRAGINFTFKLLLLPDAVVSTVFLLKHPMISRFLDMLSH